MPTGAHDAAQLWRAMVLAESAIGLSDPNPRVGCVLADADGQVVGEGFTQHAGGPHAEVVAMRAAQAAGSPLRGGTAWITLEPCSHHGRTPPCTDALIEAGLSRVVVACVDPFPQVSGRGIAQLRQAGIAVDLADGDLARQAREINIGFFSRMIRRRPWLRMKVAASLDGRTALADGRSQWITGEPARTDGHAWRRRASAVLTGIGTVRSDDPRLDVRLVPIANQPMRVVVDSHLQVPTGARILAPPGRVLIYHASADAQAAAKLRASGAELAAFAGPDGKVDLVAMLADLADRGVNELHVEAGHKLNGSLWQAGLVDELLLYLAPKLIGPGRELAVLQPLAQLDDAVNLKFVSVEPVGTDLRLLVRPIDRDAFMERN